ncbi:GIY-YIG nuclease family protein [Paraburkholderia fungorum]|uniref:GIY-YIG nuclease family protein n=1 Tax=Paraburkholderia fungorum TaxID=134537 RepID=UPI0038B6F35D
MRETILEIFAEGGSIRVFGERREESWLFTLEVADNLAAMMCADARQRACQTDSFAEVVRLLNPYPWHDLYPEVVHPEFRQDVMAALLCRRGPGDPDSYAAKAWNDACDSSTNTASGQPAAPSAQPKLSIVYVLSNAAMPGIIKIGRTSQSDANLRIAQLYTTGVPLPFDLEYACKVPNAEEVEKALHIAFAPHRLNPKREFFTMESGQAIAILKLLHKEDVTEEVAAQPDDLDAESVLAARQANAKRPRMNFAEMRIPPGSELHFTEGDASVTVAGPRKVLYEGEEDSLTNVTRRLLGLDYAVQPSPYWTWGGRLLKDIYDETYVQGPGA